MNKSNMYKVYILEAVSIAKRNLKDDNKWRNMPCLWIKSLNVVKIRFANCLVNSV